MVPSFLKLPILEVLLKVVILPPLRLLKLVIVLVLLKLVIFPELLAALKVP